MSKQGDYFLDHITRVGLVSQIYSLAVVSEQEEKERLAKEEELRAKVAGEAEKVKLLGKLQVLRLAYSNRH